MDTQELQARLKAGQVWVRHQRHVTPEPDGYERDSAPFEAADVLGMYEREIAQLQATLDGLRGPLQEYVYRTQAYAPFEHAEWAIQMGAALMRALQCEASTMAGGPHLMMEQSA